MGMATLDVRPHSRRLSALAVAGLSVLALAAFATGMGRQLAASSGPPPFPPAPALWDRSKRQAYYSSHQAGAA